MIMDKEEKFKKMLCWKICLRFLFSRADAFLHYGLILLGITASTIVSIQQVLESQNVESNFIFISDKGLLAIIAAIPGVILLIQKEFKFDKRSAWHWEYRRRLVTLKRKIEFAELEVKEACHKINTIDEEFAMTFPDSNPNLFPKKEESST